MITTIKRSVLDEIRDEIQLDNYYRKLDRKKSYESDYDFYDDLESDYEIASEYF